MSIAPAARRSSGSAATPTRTVAAAVATRPAPRKGSGRVGFCAAPAGTGSSDRDPDTRRAAPRPEPSVRHRPSARIQHSQCLRALGMCAPLGSRAPRRSPVTGETAEEHVGMQHDDSPPTNSMALLDEAETLSAIRPADGTEVCLFVADRSRDDARARATSRRPGHGPGRRGLGRAAGRRTRRLTRLSRSAAHPIAPGPGATSRAPDPQAAIGHQCPIPPEITRNQSELAAERPYSESPAAFERSSDAAAVGLRS